MDALQIGRLITQRRKEIGMTQELLAEYAALSKNTIYKIERGQANPSIKVLNQLLEILGMEINIAIKNIHG